MDRDVRPGSSVAATMNGAAEEKSPGMSTATSRSRSARVDATDLGRTRAPARLRPAASARCGRASAPARRPSSSPFAPSAGEQDRRLHLRARDRQLVVDRLAAARPSIVSGRCPSVVSICAPIRRSGSATRSIGRAESDSSPVSVNVPSWNASSPTISRARVPALPQSIVAGCEPAQADAVHRELIAVVVDLGAERAHRCERRRRCRPSARSRARRSRRRETAPSSSARCEIDLSPGTAKCPSSLTAGSTLIDDRRDDDAVALRLEQRRPRAAPRPRPRRAASACRRARARRDAARSPRC